MSVLYFVGVVIVVGGLFAVLERIGVSDGVWKAIALGLLVGLLLNQEDRFTRWWKGRRTAAAPE
jgi:hypothetical protein